MIEDRFYLQHILSSINKIQSYVQEGEGKFFQSQLVQDAVIRNFEIIGEAAKRLSEGGRAAHPTIPWKRIGGFRDVLIHHYFGVELRLVWKVIENDLPAMKSAVEHLLSGPS